MFLGDCVEETWVVHVDDLLGFAGLNRQLWYQLRNVMHLLSRQILPGTGFRARWCREAFHRLEVQNVSELYSGWCSILESRLPKHRCIELWVSVWHSPKLLKGASIVMPNKLHTWIGTASAAEVGKMQYSYFFH
jgi:hypothetical protein